MVKGSSKFRAVDLFAAIDSFPTSVREIVGFVRPHPERKDVLQIAHPAKLDEWHDLDESKVAGFTPLRTGPQVAGVGLARLFLHDTAEHVLVGDQEPSADKEQGTFETLGRDGGLSIVSGGPRYCYYDAGLQRTVCIPI